MVGAIFMRYEVPELDCAVHARCGHPLAGDVEIGALDEPGMIVFLLE
jgi:hypothetical protein